MKKDDLETRIHKILSDKSFNDLPYEQRKFICRYLQQHQILTLWQAIHNYQDLISSAYKRKIDAWIKNCVANYEKDWCCDIKNS